ENVSSTGLIQVTATSHNDARIETDGGALGLVAASETLPRAKVSGATIANFGGKATSGRGTLTVMSTSNNDVAVTVATLGIGLFTGALTKSYARVTADADTNASVTGPANVGSGVVTITSNSDDDALATINGVSVGLISLGITLSVAETFGETRAFAGQGATITAYGSTSATARNNATNVSAIGGGSLKAVANAGGIVDAFIGQPAPAQSTGTTFINVGSGVITVSAGANVD